MIHLHADTFLILKNKLIDKIIKISRDFVICCFDCELVRFSNIIPGVPILRKNHTFRFMPYDGIVQNIG